MCIPLQQGLLAGRAGVGDLGGALAVVAVTQTGAAAHEQESGGEGKRNVLGLAALRVQVLVTGAESDSTLRRQGGGLGVRSAHGTAVMARR